MAFAPPSARPSTRGGEDRSYVGSVCRGNVHSRSGLSVLSKTSSASSKLTPARLERLRDIQRRALLGGTLKQKLIAKYRNLLPEDVLTREVDAMVQKDKITTEELRVLDERMQALAQELGWSPENDDAPSSDADALDDLVSEVNALPASPGGRPSTSQALGSSTGMLGISLSLSQLMPITEGSVWGSWSEQANMLPGPKTRNNMNKTGGDSTRRDEWAVLAKYDEMAAAEEQRKRKEDAVKAQAEMRAFLTSQMQKRDIDASTRKAEEEHWAAQFSAEKAAVEAERARKEAARKAIAEREKKTREEQMEFRRTKRDLESKVRLEYEEALITKALEEAKLEEERAAAKRAAQREQVKKVLEDNAAELERRRLMKERDQAEDIRRMEEYARLTEEQEKKRQQQVEEFARKQEERAKQRVAYKPLDVSGRVLMTDEKFAEEEQRRRAAEEVAIAAKQAERKAADEECRRIIAQQLKAKQDEREREREIGVREALAAKARAEQMEIEAAEKRRAMRAKNEAHKRELQSQILTHGTTTGAPVVSDVERSMNAAQFSKAFETLKAKGLL